MNNIIIFENAKPQDGEFFKFKNVGYSIQGTYIDVRNGTDSFGNAQTIYIILDASGKAWNLGFRQTALVIHERMNGVRFGQIVGFRFDEERESKKNPGTKAKIIRIYADPKLVDHDWLKHQSEIEATYTKPSFNATVANTVEEKEEGINVLDIPFKVPEDAAPAGGNLPATEEKPRNDAIDAIRNLAKTKGLTNEAMTEKEEDETIEKYTKLPLVEENLTKIIISLTGFSKK
jgi:hypothetical protein